MSKISDYIRGGVVETKQAYPDISIGTIARKFGISRSSVHAILKEAGIKTSPEQEETLPGGDGLEQPESQESLSEEFKPGTAPSSESVEDEFQLPGELRLPKSVEDLKVPESSKPAEAPAPEPPKRSNLVPGLKDAAVSPGLAKVMERAATQQLEQEDKERKEYAARQQHLVELQAQTELERVRRETLESELVVIKAKILQNQAEGDAETRRNQPLLLQFQEMQAALGKSREELARKEFELYERKQDERFALLMSKLESRELNQWNVMLAGLDRIEKLGSTLATVWGPPPWVIQRKNGGEDLREPITAEEAKRISAEMMKIYAPEQAVENASPPNNNRAQAEAPKTTVAEVEKARVTCQNCGHTFFEDLIDLELEVKGRGGLKEGESIYRPCPECKFKLNLKDFIQPSFYKEPPINRIG